jgi:two-component system, NarL family, response regulator DesR
MIRIVIAEKQQLLLSALESLLNLEEDMVVIGHACNGEEVITLVNQLQPDICITDMDMSEKNGLQVAEELKGLACKVMILTTFVLKGSVQQAVNAGVMGYLLKDSPSELLANSIRSVMAGKKVYEQELIEGMKEESNLIEEPHSVESNLEQHNNPIGTVKAYFSTIMDKMKLPTG